MSNYGANIPDYSVPLIDQNGSINQIWWQFFVAMFNRTGAAQGGNLTDANDLSSSLDIQWSPAQDFSRLIEDMQAQIDTIQGRSDGPASGLLLPTEQADYAAALGRIKTKLDEIECQVAGFNSPIIAPAAAPVVQAWQAPTLVSGWVNYGSGFNPAGFYKDPFGIVHLRGLLKSGTVASSAFTLPIGCRPTKTESFAVSSNGAYGQVYVSAAGDVTLVVGNNAYFSLDGITFRAA